MINFDSPVIQLMYILGIDLTNISEMSTVGDYFAFTSVFIFGLFVLYLILKYLYKTICSLFRRWY